MNRNLFSKKLISYVIYTFLLSVLFLIFYQAISVFINFDTLFQNITPSEIKSNGFKSIEEISKTKLDQIKLRRFRNFIIQKSNTHTTYQGLWISFSLFILGLNIKNFKKNIFKFLATISIILLVVWLYLISARMPLLAFLVTISLTVFIFSKLSKKKKVLLFLSIPLAFSVLLLFKNPISTRFKEYYNNGVSIPNQKFGSDRFDSSNVRNGVYFCDFQVIKENIFIGVGVGDIQDELNYCYSNKIGAKVYTWRDYNSHNQYAFFWISAGFMGFVGFIVFIVNIFIKSIRTLNIKMFYLICSSSIVFISENLLERSDGVVFFFFFIALLYYNRGLKAT
ncbi:O-antigen ligase family protein [uncultured Polaribacter sp.]|uniref:O-antigen ligase family protein n=1 Tax=uncultured Polaribacter sp. TaxID=174711 RepID=UPI002633622D|nr:O-antigen ligase family protein [uncultured Polaribacter sp.]